jgi:hypothetical protein
VAAREERGERYRFGRETYRAMGRFPAWAKALPRNRLLFFSDPFLFSFLFLFETFWKTSKLIQNETKNL